MPLPLDVNTTETLQPARLPTTLFQSRLAKFKSRTTFKAQLPGAPVGTSGQILIHHNGLEFVPTSPPPVRPTLYFTGKKNDCKVNSDRVSHVDVSAS